MWLEEIEELFRLYLPYYLLIVLPIFIIVCPSNPVLASHEFPVYRMQQFDLHGVAHGCRSSAINLEARSLNGWSTQRHCVIAKWNDMTIDHFQNLRTKVGGLLIVLPNDMTSLSAEEKQNFLLLEAAMMAQEISIPVYFASWSEELEALATEISQSIQMNDLSRSAAEAVVSSIAANGYQFVASSPTPNVRTDVKVATIQGHLTAYRSDAKVATIAIVAYYDSFGVSPELSFGSDANGSGVAILLELIRLFSHLYSDPRTQGKYNIVFLLTGGGKFNYQGSKKFLEDQFDSHDSSIIQDASYVMCLDTLAAGDTIFMHVSKPPKDGSPSSQFFKQLKVSADHVPDVKIDGVHKKINLADDILAWEHERYSIRRLPAFTLSTVRSHRDPVRGSILDIKDNTDVKRLARNAKVIVEALAGYVYNVSVGDVFGSTLDVDQTGIGAWLDYLTSEPRSAQILSKKDNPMVHSMRDHFNKYLSDVKVTYVSPDKRDPDFLFYDGTRGTMNVYSVKPAVFDLVLTLAIVSYLGLIYVVVQKFAFLYSFSCSLTVSKSVKVK